MNQLMTMTQFSLFLSLSFYSALCQISLNASQSDSTLSKSTTSSYMITRYVSGSGGIHGSVSSSNIHSATAGQTFVGFMQGNNNLLLSGFWQPGMLFTNVNEKVEVNHPKTFALHQNYPNPFNPQTTIRYDLPGEYHVNIEIFNVAGQKVRLLMDNEIQGPGAMEISWNGLNNDGEMLSSGVYLCRVHCRSIGSEKSNSEQEFQNTIKMLLVR